LIPLKILPLRWAIEIGGAIGLVAYWLRIRVKVSRKNLALTFGDKLTAQQKEKIIAESYKNFGRSTVEFALMNRFKGKLTNYIQIDNKNLFDSISGKMSAVLVSGHFSSWELMGAGLAEYGYPIDFLVGKQKNSYIDNMMNNLRSQMGIGLIPIGISARRVIKALRKKRFVAMLSDQDAGEDGEVVQFFNQPASTPKGPAAFAMQMNCPILAGVILRVEPLRYKVYVKQLNPPTDTDKSEAIRLLTQQYTTILEGFIKKWPEHYFWAHRRFKSSAKGIYK